MAQLGCYNQEDAFAQHSAELGAKQAVPPERGVWVELSRLDYHLIGNCQDGEAIGLLINKGPIVRSRGRVPKRGKYGSLFGSILLGLAQLKK